MKKAFKTTLFIMFLLALGYFRENVFVGMNAVLYNKLFNPTGVDVHTIRPGFRFLTGFSYQTLYAAKWFITPFFAFVFWFTQKKFIWFLFHEKKSVTWLSVLYLSLFLLAGISFCTGWLFGYLQEGYRFSRIFMGLLESPAPCMILIPLTYFYKNSKSSI